jgi:molybdate transport system regulatory protein
LIENILSFILHVNALPHPCIQALGSSMKAMRFDLYAELTVRVDDQMLANAKRIELLRQIERLGNLTQAAKLAGYSYKGAWDSIEQMAQLSGGTLIERHAGGKGGGGTELTERGRQLLRNFSLIQAEHGRFIARLNKLANGLSNDYALANDIAMKTSARNQYAGIIVSITPGLANDELGILVHGNQMLTASITHDSCRDLQLEVGAKVFALVKASALVVKPIQARVPAEKNAFIGRAQRIVSGDKKSELAILLDTGTEWVATIDNQVLAEVALQEGDPVMVSFDPSSVIIGIAA